MEEKPEKEVKLSRTLREKEEPKQEDLSIQESVLKSILEGSNLLK